MTAMLGDAVNGSSRMWSRVTGPQGQARSGRSPAANGCWRVGRAVMTCLATTVFARRRLQTERRKSEGATRCVTKEGCCRRWPGAQGWFAMSRLPVVHYPHYQAAFPPVTFPTRKVRRARAASGGTKGWGGGLPLSCARPAPASTVLDRARPHPSLRSTGSFRAGCTRKKVRREIGF
jgi:hypothetical protein